MSNQIVCSENIYTRDEALKKLQSLTWFKNSKKEVQDKLMSAPQEFDGFINDLVDRPEESGDFIVLSLDDISYAEHYAIPVFEIKSKLNQEIYLRAYVSWRKGIYNSTRGLILLETDNKITHFVVRKCDRFSILKETYESLSSIYPPREIRESRSCFPLYMEDQLSSFLKVPGLKFSRFIDLGQVYTDVRMSNNIVNIYAAIINTENLKSFNESITNKVYNEKGYAYSFEILPISQLLDFLSKTDDSLLLAIFGRLQALNVIKL